MMWRGVQVSGVRCGVALCCAWVMLSSGVASAQDAGASAPPSEEAIVLSEPVMELAQTRAPAKPSPSHKAAAQ